MLRLTRRALVVLPNTRVAELPNFLSTPDLHVTPRDGDLYQFVLEHDHKSAMTDYFHSEQHATHFAKHPFSGSGVAAATTTGGVFLFALCFGYFVGKPVVDAHQELWASLSEEEVDDTDFDEGGPIEEEGDLFDS